VDILANLCRYAEAADGLIAQFFGVADISALYVCSAEMSATPENLQCYFPGISPVQAMLQHQINFATSWQT